MTQQQVDRAQNSRPTKYRRWAFTLNNYDVEEPWKTMEELPEQKTLKYIVAGKEFAPSTGTRHLQGYLEYFNCRSFQGTTRHLHEIFGGNCHLEVAHSSLNENYLYCTKEDKYPFVFKGTKKDSTKTEKSDIGEMAEVAAKEGTEACKEVYRMEYYIQKQAIDKAANALRSDIALKKLKEEFETATLKPWQHVVMKLVEIQGNREILFVIDDIGNQGKTWLTQYMTIIHEGQCFDSTNKKDVAYALNPEKNTFIFDVTRATEPKMSLQILESIKNGIVFSGKYESGTKIVSNAKVILMANSFNELHEAQLSVDRFMILHLKPVMGQMNYEFQYWDSTNSKRTVTGPNGQPGTVKEIIDHMALTERRWKRKFMRWGAEIYKWGANVHPNLRLRQNGYDRNMHRMKRLQDFNDEEAPSLTQQGVPDPFQTPEAEEDDNSESEEEDDDEDFGHWSVAV